MPNPSSTEKKPSKKFSIMLFLNGLPKFFECCIEHNALETVCFCLVIGCLGVFFGRAFQTISNATPRCLFSIPSCSAVKVIHSITE